MRQLWNGQVRSLKNTIARKIPEPSEHRLLESADSSDVDSQDYLPTKAKTARAKPRNARSTKKRQKRLKIGNKRVKPISKIPTRKDVLEELDQSFGDGSTVSETKTKHDKARSKRDLRKVKKKRQGKSVSKQSHIAKLSVISSAEETGDEADVSANRTGPENTHRKPRPHIGHWQSLHENQIRRSRSKRLLGLAQSSKHGKQAQLNPKSQPFDFGPSPGSIANPHGKLRRMTGPLRQPPSLHESASALSLQRHATLKNINKLGKVNRQKQSLRRVVSPINNIHVNHFDLSFGQSNTFIGNLVNKSQVQGQPTGSRTGRPGNSRANNLPQEKLKSPMRDQDQVFKTFSFMSRQKKVDDDGGQYSGV